MNTSSVTGIMTKLKFNAFHQWRWPSSTVQEVVGRRSNKVERDSYVLRNGRRNFIHSFIAQVADQKSTLWIALGLNRVVDQNDGTIRIERARVVSKDSNCVVVGSAVSS